MPKNAQSESEVAQSCPTLCGPVDGNLLGFYVHGILQGRILEWIAISFFRGSSQPRAKILECEVKWALESITTKKLVEAMELQLSYFKS